MSKMKAKIKKGDDVSIITGKNKGGRGKVLRVLKKKSKPEAGLFVVVEGINLVKKNIKSNGQEPGSVISKEMPLAISNVALIDPKTHQPGGKVGYKFLENGQKVRFFKKTGEVINA